MGAKQIFCRLTERLAHFNFNVILFWVRRFTEPVCIQFSYSNPALLVECHLPRATISAFVFLTHGRSYFK